MSDPSESTVRSVHRLVEHYTPDGTLGRLLLGGPALALAPFMFLGGWTMLFGGVIVPLLLMSLFVLVAGIAAFPLGVIVLWPVYLSLIGNLDAPEEYAHTSVPSTGTAGNQKAAGSRKESESPETVLKRRYAAGELGREEFERRLDDVMGTARPDDREPRDDDPERLETLSSR